MKILVAPNSYKGSVSALEAAGNISKGFNQALPNAETILCPLPDGGTGTIEVIKEGTNGHYVEFQSPDLDGNPSASLFLSYGTSIYIESASIIGFDENRANEGHLLSMSSYGLGVAITKALDHGAYTIIVGLGGSATNDGGIGALAALGVRFYDDKGNLLNPIPSSLSFISHIDSSLLDKRAIKRRLVFLSDVDNRLLGPEGATYSFGPQKGAKRKKTLDLLEKGMENLRNVILSERGVDISITKFGGSAGGIGATLPFFLEAPIFSGSRFISDIMQLEEKVRDSDVIVSGEGKLDSTSLSGKGFSRVLELSRKYHKPLLTVTGIDNGISLPDGLMGSISLSSIAGNESLAMEKASHYMELAAKELVNRFPGFFR